MANTPNNAKEDPAKTTLLDAPNNRDPDLDSDSDSEAEDGSDVEKAAGAGVSVEKKISAHERKAQKKERKKRKQAREWEKRQQAEKAKQELKEARRKQQEEAEGKKTQKAKEMKEAVMRRTHEQKLLDEIQKLRDENQRLKDEREKAKHENESAQDGKEIEQDSHLHTAQDNLKQTGPNNSPTEVKDKRGQRIKQPQPESRRGKRTERLTSPQSQTQVKMNLEKKYDEETKPRAKTNWREKRKPKCLEEATATAEKSLQPGSNVDGVEHSTGYAVPPPTSHSPVSQPPVSQPTVSQQPVTQQPVSQPPTQPSTSQSPASQPLALQPLVPQSPTSELQPAPQDRLRSPKQVSAPQSPAPLVDPEEQALREAMYPLVQQRGRSLPQTPTDVEPPILLYHPQSVPSNKSAWKSPLPSPVEDPKHVDEGESTSQASLANTVEQSGVNNFQLQPFREQGQEFQDRDASIQGSGESTGLNPESDPWANMAQVQADRFQTPQSQPPQRLDMVGSQGAPRNPELSQVYQPPSPPIPNTTEYNGAQ
ncbi:hypothetical protein F4776DRAFT_134671 [Hypoxylon sp. NC0597]|nr:hypothetical protein F4776DRAFT_134671 [Hypoxylon sp. NC0597]